MTVTPKKLFTPAQLTTSLATYYTAPTSTKTVIKKATLTNNNTSPETASIYLVETGGTAGATNIILKDKAIGPGETYEIYEMEGHIMNAGDFVRGIASSASQVTFHLSGVEIV